MDKITAYAYHSDESEEEGYKEPLCNITPAKIGINNNNNTTSPPLTKFRKIDAPVPLGPTKEWKDKYSNKQPTRFDGSTKSYEWKESNWGPSYYQELREKEELLKQHPLYKFYKVLTSLINERSGGIKGMSLDPFDMSSQEERFLRNMLKQRNLFQLTPENLILERNKLDKLRNEANMDLQRIKRQNVAVVDGMKAFKDAMRGEELRKKMIYLFFLELIRVIPDASTYSLEGMEGKFRETLDKFIIVLDNKRFNGSDTIRYIYEICKYAKNTISEGRVNLNPTYSMVSIRNFVGDFVTTMRIDRTSQATNLSYRNYVTIFTEVQKLLRVLTETDVLYGESEVIKTLLNPEILQEANLGTAINQYLEDNPKVKKSLEDFIQIWNVNNEVSIYISYDLERLFEEDDKLREGGKNLRNLDSVWERYYIEEKRRIESRLSSSGDSITWISKRLHDISTGNLDVSGTSSKYYPTFETMMSSYNTGVINLGPVEGHINTVYHNIKEKFPKYAKGKDWTEIVTNDDDYVPFAKLVSESYHSARINNPTTYIPANQTGLVNKNLSDAYAYFRKKEATVSGTFSLF
jgi:hypothetical protein